MFRFLQRFDCDSQARSRGTGPFNRVRRRNHRLNCEALEGRQMLSGYYLINVASGKVLDDPGGSTSDGVQIDQWQLDGGANQRWDLVGVGNGNVYIQNEASHLVLDNSFSTSDGTNIDQSQSYGGLNQQWHFVPSGNGEAIVNAYSNTVIGDPGFSNSNGTGIIQWQLNDGQNEQWTLVAAGDASPATYYINNEASGRVIDDPGSTSNVTNIEQWQLDGGANQQWTFVQIPNGNYFIVNASSGMVLDDPHAETGNGVDIEQFQLTGGYNQEWTVTQQPDGLDVITNAYSLQVLDDPNFSTSNGSPIDQFQPLGGANQQWDLLELGNGPAATYYVANPSGGFLDSQGSNSEGTGVITTSNNDGVYEQWTFVPLIDGHDLIVNVGSGLVLDDPPSFSTNNVDQWQLNDGPNQEWNLVTEFRGDGEFLVAMVNENSGGVLEITGNGYAVVCDTNGYGGYPGTGDQDWYLRPVSASDPAGVDIHGQPSNAVVGHSISPAITVAVVDAKGNTITTNNSQLVTLSIASGPKGAQLLGTTTVRAVNGVADFTNLTLSLAGNYTLTATGGTLTPDFSNVFTVAPVNVTSAVTIRRRSVHKIGRPKASRNGAELVAQTITIKNASRQPLGGPLALRVGGLPSGVTLANATGTYEGGSYRDVLAALQPLAPGKSVTVTLDFSMSGRRSPSLSKLDDDLEALLGI
jgi:hypothetical protein